VPVSHNTSPHGVWMYLPEAPRTGGFFILCAFALLSAGAAQQSSGTFLSDLNRVDILTSQGKTDAAVALLDTLSETEPKPSGLEAKLGKAYFKNGKFQPAIRHLRIALEQTPDDWESVQLLALSHYSAGNCQQALPLLLKLGPHLPKGAADAPYLIGVCYLKAAQWDSARETFAAMFSAPPESAMAHLMLAKMMVRQHLEERSIPEIRKAVELDPRLPMAHFLLGEIYLYQESPQRALEEFQKELAINPTVWLVYWRLGDAYARLEKYDDAEKVLKEAIWLNETFTGSYLLLGEIQLKKGDLELAAGFLNQALKLDPKNYYAHYSLARAYQQMGRTEEANRHFEATRALRGEKKIEEEHFFQGMTR
jgi:tetratricopeptide (TPR) repeat protein